MNCTMHMYGWNTSFMVQSFLMVPIPLIQYFLHVWFLTLVLLPQATLHFGINILLFVGYKEISYTSEVNIYMSFSDLCNICYLLFFFSLEDIVMASYNSILLIMRPAWFIYKSKKRFFKGNGSLKRNIEIKENWTKVSASAIFSSLQNIDDEKNGYFRRSGQSDSVCQLSRQLLCILPLCVASVRGKSYSVFDFFSF